MMNPDLLAPAMAQFAIIFALGVATGVSRVNAVATGATRGRQLATGQQDWPGRCQQISSAFNNQFQTPLFFIAGLIFAMLAEVSDPILVILAWTYIATRVVHALIYVTVNIIPIRFLVFITGFAAIAGIWGVVGWRVLGGA